MITKELFDNEIEKRMKQIEKDVDKRLKYETKEGIELSELFQLGLHIKNPEVMSDAELYEKMSDNELAVIAERLTGDLGLAKKITDVCNKTIKRIELPGGLTREQKAEFFIDRRLKSTMDKARKKLIKLIGKRTETYEENRLRMVKEIQAAEMKKINEALERAERLAETGEKFEGRLLSVLKELEKELSAEMNVKKEIIQLSQKEEFTMQHVESMQEKMQMVDSRKDKINELKQQRKEIERQLSTIKRQIISVLEGEIKRPIEEVPKAEEFAGELVRV